MDDALKLGPETKAVKNARRRVHRLVARVARPRHIKRAIDRLAKRLNAMQKQREARV